MKKYRALLFDLDGTLIYSHPGIFACFRYALEKMGKEEPTEKQLRRCVGPPLEFSFEHYFSLTPEDARKATEIYREEYRRTGVFMNELVPQVKDSLEAWQKQGYLLATSTSKAQTFAEQILKRLEIYDRFAVVVGCGLDGSLNTKGAVIAETVKRLGVTAEDCLMIGDRLQDLEGANENGMDCAILRLGYAEEGEFEKIKPEYLCEDYRELQELLKR